MSGAELVRVARNEGITVVWLVRLAPTLKKNMSPRMPRNVRPSPAGSSVRLIAPIFSFDCSLSSPAPRRYTVCIRNAARSAILVFLDRLPHAILLHAEGRIVFANARMHRLLGAAPGELEGIPLDSLAQPDDIAALRTLAQSELPRELAILKSDGTEVWVQVEGLQISFDGRDVEQLSMTDVSARRNAEEGRREMAELTRRQEEQLEHSTRLAELGEMAASISSR